MPVSGVLMMVSAWVNPESKFINNEPMLQYSDSAVLINIQFPIFDTDEKKKSSEKALKSYFEINAFIFASKM